MKADDEELLRRTFPLVYGGPFLNDEPFRCGQGWLSILVRLGAVLQALIEQLPEAERARYRAVQVKEKFACLRVYLADGETDGMTEAILLASAESRQTCDVCGGPGELVTDRGEFSGWLRTRCAAHANERDR